MIKRCLGYPDCYGMFSGEEHEIECPLAGTFGPPSPCTTRNSETLSDFVAYCKAHPQLRFWQALLNWSMVPYILISSHPLYDAKTSDAILKDPYYWEGKNS